MAPPLDLARRGSLDNVQGCVELLGEHPDRRRPVYRSWCGHRSVTFVERLTAAEAEVRRPDILVAKLVDDLKRHDKCGADIYDRRHDEKRIRPETVRPVVD